MERYCAVASHVKRWRKGTNQTEAYSHRTLNTKRNAEQNITETVIALSNPNTRVLTAASHNTCPCRRMCYVFYLRLQMTESLTNSTPLPSWGGGTAMMICTAFCIPAPAKSVIWTPSDGKSQNYRPCRIHELQIISTNLIANNYP